MALLIDAGGQVVIRDFVKLAYYRNNGWEIGVDEAGAGEITYDGGNRVHVLMKNGIGGDVLFNDADLHGLANALGVTVKKLAGLNVEFKGDKSGKIFIKIGLQKDLGFVSTGFSIEVGTSIKEILCLHRGICNAIDKISHRREYLDKQIQLGGG